MPYTPPPFLFKRNDLGLINDGSINYVYDEDGRINWRKMVPSKYLVPNKQLTNETDITKLEDSKLLITLAGIRYIAKVRGYFSFDFSPIVASENYFATSCGFVWVPNYESEYVSLYSEALADASPESTKGFAMNYLAAIAENRAFVRCVRNFLNITIVGEEEVGIVENTALDNNVVPTPASVLQSLMDKKGLSFDIVKAKLIEQNFEKAIELTKLEELPQLKIYELIDKIKKL